MPLTSEDLRKLAEWMDGFAGYDVVMVIDGKITLTLIPKPARPPLSVDGEP